MQGMLPLAKLSFAQSISVYLTAMEESTLHKIPFDNSIFPICVHLIRSLTRYCTSIVTIEKLQNTIYHETMSMFEIRYLQKLCCCLRQVSCVSQAAVKVPSTVLVTTLYQSQTGILHDILPFQYILRLLNVTRNRLMNNYLDFLFIQSISKH